LAYIFEILIEILNGYFPEVFSEVFSEFFPEIKIMIFAIQKKRLILSNKTIFVYYGGLYSNKAKALHSISVAYS